MQIDILLKVVHGQPLFSIPSAVWMGILVIVIIVCAGLYYDWLYRRLERRVSTNYRGKNSRLALIMRANNTRVWTYEVATRRYQRLNNEGLLDNEYTPIDFSRFFDKDDFEEMRHEIFSIRDGKKQFVTMQMRGPKTEGGIERRRYEMRITVLKSDENGKPQTLLGVQRDITHEKQKREREREELLTYQNVFDSALLDMVFYDENGILSDINDAACKTFQIADKQVLINSQTHLRDVTYYDDVDIPNLEMTRSTSVIDLVEMEKEGRKAVSVESDERLYYEMMLYPIRDEQGEMLGFFLEGRNATDMVAYYKMQRQTMRNLQKATADVKAYIENINLALQTAECRIMNYLPDTHTLQITSDLNKPLHMFSQIRALDFIDPSDRRSARRILHQMDHRSLKYIRERMKTIFPANDEENVWLTFSGVPMHDAKGQITHYFGMSRNDTRIVMTEKRLKEETQKAQEAEALKNTFLLNMSYEIRTPLSTVIGFAELFDKEHNPEDESVFVEEIKRNSNDLLALVNDILFLSRVDARMIEAKRQPTDFAASFDAHCHMGWSGNTNPELKTIIENPYEHLVVDIDEQLLGDVIEKLIQNSVFYTKEGTIRAKYVYRSNRLIIAIEDTGNGLPEELQKHLFDRFTDKSQAHLGSGLTLPIVKGLVELMDGSIEVTSEVGNGTTIWVNIPCEVTSSEKKKEII